MVDRCQAFWCEKYLLKKPIPAGTHGRKGLLLLVSSMKKKWHSLRRGHGKRVLQGL